MLIKTVVLVLFLSVTLSFCYSITVILPFHHFIYHCQNICCSMYTLLYHSLALPFNCYSYHSVALSIVLSISLYRFILSLYLLFCGYIALCCSNIVSLYRSLLLYQLFLLLCPSFCHCLSLYLSFCHLLLLLYCFVSLLFHHFIYHSVALSLQFHQFN